MVKTKIQLETENSLNASVVPHFHHGDGEPDFPTFFTQLKNLLGTIKDFIKDDFRLSDQDEWKNRFKICSSCEFFKNNRCRKCGCYGKIKNRIKAAKCPMEKWENGIIIDDETR